MYEIYNLSPEKKQASINELDALSPSKRLKIRAKQKLISDIYYNQPKVYHRARRRANRNTCGRGAIGTMIEVVNRRYGAILTELRREKQHRKEAEKVAFSYKFNPITGE